MHTSASPAGQPVTLRRSLFNRLAQLLFVAALAFSALGTQAKIGAAYQLLLGNPSNAVTDPAVKNNYLIVRDQFAISYNDSLGQPNWVSWNLTSEDRGSSGRTDAWSEDPLLPAGVYRVQPTDYSNSGYTRGHMCPSADRTVTTADNTYTFLMSNMVPQTAHNNNGVWNEFEMETRNIAAAGNEVLVISGASHYSGSRISPSGVASIPDNIWKIVVVVPVGTAPITERITTSTRVIAIKVPNVTSGLSLDWRQYLTSVNQIQQDTGFTFFTELPPATASVLRTMIDGQPVVGAPVITANPSAQSIAAGGTANFSVTATGDAPLAYQWYFEGQAISGATSSTLAVNNVQLEDMGSYHVTVTNSVSSTTSTTALLVVTGVAPVFINEPMSQTANAGSNVVFTALVGGSPTMTYQWRRNGQPLSGATSTTLTLTNVQAANAGDYDLVATNGDGSATSGAATLEVEPSAPVITSQPAPSSVGLNGTATFSVTATGTEPITYQWRKDGVTITGNTSAATATLTIPNVSESSVGSYDVVLTNSVDSVTSSAAALTISAFVNGGLNYSGGTYAQNFDSLFATQGYDSDVAVSISGNGPHQLTAAPFNGTELGAWWIVKYGGSGTNARFRADDGTAVNGAIYSYGTSGSAERALGSLGSGSTQSRFGMILNNNTGQTLTQFTISYTGEQWRDGNSATNTLSFAYAIDATDLNTGTFVSASSLNLTSPNSTTSSTSGVVLDGNAPANRRAVSATVTGIVWPAGSRLIVRWTDADDTNNDDGLAIDDFTFTATSSGPVAPAVVSTSPAHDATGVSPTTTIAVTFNQPVTLAGGWFTLTSAAQGALTGTVSGGPSSYTITPGASFALSDTITVNIAANAVRDQSTDTLTLAEDYSFSFATSAPVAPSITTQPASQSVAVGANVTFTVAASGTAPFTYQWRKGGQNINGATNATLTLSNVQLADAGSYDVVVTNSVNSATSNAATLTVSAATSSAITWNFTTASPSSTLPAGVTGGTVTQGNSFGATTMLSTSAASSNYTGASGGNNAAQTARIGALVPGANGSAYFEFTFTPETGRRLLVSAMSFGSRSTSTGPQAYALYTSVDNYTTPAATGTLPSGTTGWFLHTPSFSTVTGALNTAVTFRLYGYNGGPNSPSSGTANWRIDDLSLTVAVQSAPTVTTAPVSQTVVAGTDANFTVTATGTDPLAYQWRKGGQNISGATSSSYTITGVQAADAGSYDVVVTNAAGSATSAAATLTVLTGFDVWQYANFNETERGNPSVSGPNAVLSTDGLTNLMKYALGLDPRVAATSGVPEAGANATHWTYTFTRPADRTDVVYQVQASANLTDWTSLVPTVELTGTQDGVQTWRATYSRSGATVLFFRLRVTR